MAEIKAVAWDLDGTLADSEVHAMPAAVGGAANYVEEQKPGTLITAEDRAAFVQQLMGKTITEIGDAVGEQFGVTMPDNFKERVMGDTISLLKRECKVIPGAMETVGLLSAANLRQWIATSSASSRVAPTLEATGLLAHFPEEGNHWFSAIITKPDPEVYVRSVAAHGFCPENVASVEDSPTGVSAAVSAGMGYIIAFTGGSHIPKSQREAHGQKLLAAGAHIVVDDLRHIPTVITAHNARQEPTAGPRPQPLPARAGATEAFRYK